MTTPEYVCPGCKTNTTCVSSEQEQQEQPELRVFECPRCHNVYMVMLDEIK